jgi:hypothetical protein
MAQRRGKIARDVTPVVISLGASSALTEPTSVPGYGAGDRCAEDGLDVARI